MLGQLNQPTNMYIMKSKCISVALIFTFFSLFSQTTLVPDLAFENALIVAGIDTNGQNGNILNSDAAVPTFLSVSSNSISDLSGIEAFVNLQTLYCDNNSLTSLDIS